MSTRRAGTQPIIAHGSVYLRPAELDDLPLFVGWFNDDSMSRTLAIRAPMSLASLERVWLDVYDFNPNARRVYARAGFVDEGVSRHAIFREGAYRDLYRMAILREEWTALAGEG